MPPPAPIAARALTEIDVEFISLVSAPANGRPLTLKHARGLTPRSFALKAGPDELRRAYGIVYPVDAVDTQGDTASAATVLRAADRWMLAGRAANVDRQHSFTPEQAWVAESWIVRPGDPLFADETPGGWAVGIQIGDPGLWAQLKSGQLAGLSLAGMVEVADPPAGDDGPDGADPIGKKMMKFLRSLTKGERDVTSDEIKQVIKEEVPGVVAAAVKAALADQRAGPAADDKPPTEKSAGITKADLTTAVTEKSAGITKADLTTAVADAVATIKGDLALLVKSELTAALTKGASESDGAGSLPYGDGELGGLL